MRAAPRSLTVRLLSAAAGLLVVAFGIALVLLDSVFRSTSETATRNILEVQILALLGAAEIDAAGRLALPERLPETRLSSPGSGLFAEIADEAGRPIWRSPSAVGISLSEGPPLQPGQRRFERRILEDSAEALVLGIGIVWEFGAGLTREFNIFAGEDLTAYRQQLGVFRRQLFGWFALVIVTLMSGLWLLLRAGLQPLRRMSDEIAAIEAGRRDLLSEALPAELSGVARNLNAFVRSERQRMRRFRTTMDDLAHSLKTPLAVARSEVEGLAPNVGTLKEQVGRMQDVIDYQLRRAAASGPRTIATQATALMPIVQDIGTSLKKIYRDKPVELETQVPDGFSLNMEPGDVYEIVGNLLDNAWKFSHAKIVFTAASVGPTADGQGGEILLTVEDDGGGMPSAFAEQALSRGRRGHPRGDIPGQGIGLAVVDEIVGLYRGRIAFGDSRLGGVRVELRLPARFRHESS